MGLVQVDEGAVAFGHPAQRGHVGAVAVHAEHTFRHNQARARLAGALGQQRIQVVEIVVPETYLPHARGLAAVMQAGMVQPVAEHQRVALARYAQQGRQHGGVDLPARGEQQRRLGPLEAGQLGFDGFVQVEIARHQARGARAGAMARRPVGHALGQQGMPGQAEIVVAGEIDDVAAVERHMPAARRGDSAQTAPRLALRGAVELLGKQGIEYGHGPAMRPRTPAP